VSRCYRLHARERDYLILDRGQDVKKARKVEIKIPRNAWRNEGRTAGGPQGTAPARIADRADVRRLKRGTHPLPNPPLEG